MPDKRLHRGAHPEDARLFAAEQWETLRAAVADLAWLLTHGYAIHSALKLVGDHYNLTERQRIAVMRGTCSEQSRAYRRKHQLTREETAGKPLELDGYNVITTLESALAGAVLLEGCDGCVRDMASLHGHYKRVAETQPAIEMVGRFAQRHLGGSALHWLLDKPVSNSGRLKTILRQTAEQFGWPWTVELVNDPDPILAVSKGIIATADSVILDGWRGKNATTEGPRWFNLTREIIATMLPGAVVIGLGESGG